MSSLIASNQTWRPRVQHADVHPRPAVALRDLAAAVAGAGGGDGRGGGQLAAVGAVAAGRAVDGRQHGGEARLADAADRGPREAAALLARRLLLLVAAAGLVPLPLVAVAVRDVRLQVPPAQVSPPAAVVPVPDISKTFLLSFFSTRIAQRLYNRVNEFSPAASDSTEENITKPRLLHSHHLLIASATFSV